MATIAADHDENNVLLHWRITLTDITREKKVEEELRQAQKMKAIGNLAGGIAHETNNMLAIILGNTELLAETSPETSPASDILDDIQEASLRARETMSNLWSETTVKVSLQKSWRTHSSPISPLRTVTKEREWGWPLFMESSKTMVVPSGFQAKSAVRQVLKCGNRPCHTSSTGQTGCH